MKARHWLLLLPFLLILGCVPFVNQVEPYVFGLPFLLFWIVLCVVLTSALTAFVYWLDARNREDDAR